MYETIDHKQVSTLAAILHQRLTQPTVAESVETAIKIIQEAQAACKKYNDEVRPA
jgi:hypothetical protein